MTLLAENIKGYFEEIIDDSVSEDFAYALMNSADEELQDERDWAILRASVTIARIAGNDYEDGYDLPTNFNRPRMGDSIVSDNQTYKLIDYDQKEEYKNVEGYCYIDYALTTPKIFFTGIAQTAENVIVLYQKRGTELAEGVNCVWPGQKGLYLAWVMAQRVAGGADGDELNFRMSSEQRQTAREMKSALNHWDSSIRIRNMGGSTGIRRSSSLRTDGRINRN